MDALFGRATHARGAGCGLLQPVLARGCTASAIAGVTVEQVPFEAPRSWLAAGGRDMCAVPRVSLAYGVLLRVLLGCCQQVSRWGC